MKEQPQSIMGKLDSIIEKLDKIEERQIGYTEQDDNKKHSEQEKIEFEPDYSLQERKTKYFIYDSSKEYVWFGHKSEFNRLKVLVIVFAALLISYEIVSSIITSVSSNYYSIFTMIENVWTAFIMLIFSYTIHAKKKMVDIDLMLHSSYIFTIDKSKTWRNTRSEKRIIKWTRRISYLASIANIIELCIKTNGPITVVSIVFEVLLVVSSFIFYLLYKSLFITYGSHILYTEKENSNNGEATIVYDTVNNTTHLYDELPDGIKAYL